MVARHSRARLRLPCWASSATRRVMAEFGSASPAMTVKWFAPGTAEAGHPDAHNPHLSTMLRLWRRYSALSSPPTTASGRPARGRHPKKGLALGLTLREAERPVHGRRDEGLQIEEARYGVGTAREFGGQADRKPNRSPGGRRRGDRPPSGRQRREGRGREGPGRLGAFRRRSRPRAPWDRDRSSESQPSAHAVEPAREMAEGRPVERLPIAAMDEEYSGAVLSASGAKMSISCRSRPRGIPVSRRPASAR